MSYSKVHDYLVKNDESLSTQHKTFLSWLKHHANFLVGIEKFFLMLHDDLSPHVWHNTQGANTEVISAYAAKSQFTFLEKMEHKILDDLRVFRKLFKKRLGHNLVINDYLRELELHCLFLQKYIRPVYA